MIRSTRDLSILVADDREETTKRISQILMDRGFRRVRVLSRATALTEFEGYDLVFMDIIWIDGSSPEGERFEFGLSVLSHLRRRCPDCIVILMSTHLFDLKGLREIRWADDYFRIPDDLGDLSLPQLLSDTVDKVFRDRARRLTDILEQAIADGRPDLFGQTSSQFETLKAGVRELKQRIVERGDASNGHRYQHTGSTADLLERLTAACGPASNLADLFTDMRPFLEGLGLLKDRGPR